MIPRQRTQSVITAEIEDVCRRRAHAARELDFDAYQNLCEYVDDLRIELYALSQPRTPIR